jgi:hypothetical protein
MGNRLKNHERDERVSLYEIGKEVKERGRVGKERVVLDGDKYGREGGT